MDGDKRPIVVKLEAAEEVVGGGIDDSGKRGTP